MYERILIVLEDHLAARVAVKEGTALARLHGSQVVFFCMIPQPVVALPDAPPLMAVSPKDYQIEARARSERLLAAAARVARRRGVASTGVLGHDFNESDCVLDAAAQHRCGLIVVASEGQNALVRLVSGNVIPRLITASAVPVLVCQGNPRRAAARRPHDAASQQAASADLNVPPPLGG
jgi:nucleotide-binding universal stress UspA family protein